MGGWVGGWGVTLGVGGSFGFENQLWEGPHYEAQVSSRILFLDQRHLPVLYEPTVGC